MHDPSDPGDRNARGQGSHLLVVASLAFRVKRPSLASEGEEPNGWGRSRPSNGIVLDTAPQGGALGNHSVGILVRRLGRLGRTPQKSNCGPKEAQPLGQSVPGTGMVDPKENLVPGLPG